MHDIDPDDALLIATQFLALSVIADDRWERDGDEFGTAVFAFILYGYTLKYSRILGFDPANADAVLHYVLTKHAHCSESFAESILAEAKKSAFDPNYHRGQFNLISVGSGYLFSENLNSEVNNVYENIRSYRQNKVEAQSN